MVPKNFCLHGDLNGLKFITWRVAVSLSVLKRISQASTSHNVQYSTFIIVFYWPKLLIENGVNFKYHCKILTYLHLTDCCVSFFSLDAISQNYSSSKKRKRQEENGTYEQYQREQKRRQRIKRVSILIGFSSFWNTNTVKKLFYTGYPKHCANLSGFSV